MSTEAPIYPSAPQIPVDLFVSKKHKGLARGELGFADSSGNLLFKATRISSKRRRKWAVVDISGDPRFSIHHRKGCWHGFKGNGKEEKDMAFRVQRTLKRLWTVELQVFLVKENSGESTSDFEVKGCPFQKSCIVYGNNAIVAQSSLMYKLHQIFVRRNIFRLTIFPGCADHALLVAFVVIFLYG